VASLPSWFEANRVQGHTRLTFGTYDPARPRFWYGTEEFKHAGRGFAALGAGVFARHVKSGDEDPWWPTREPFDRDGRRHSSRPRIINGVTLAPGINVARQIIDEAHGEGLKIIVYYWDAAEATAAGLRPEWICHKRPGGRVMNSGRGPALDLTGEYRELVLSRLFELAEMGADGFLFDNLHLPRPGCWYTALEEAWKAATGDKTAPTAPKKGEQPSWGYLEFLDFRARKIEDTFTYWRDAVKARHPNVVFVVSVDDFASLMNRGVTTRLVRIADSSKNEFWQVFHPSVDHDVFKNHRRTLAIPASHVRQSLSWTVLRDSSDSRPPHIWHPGVPSSEQAVALAASLLTFGAIANMDVSESSLLTQTDQRGKTPVEGLKLAFDLGKRVSPHLAGAKPVRWAAIHFGERSRNGRGFDYVAMWRQVLWPLLGAYMVLSEDGLPVGIVTDDQLIHGGLAGYRLLVLPNATELTSGQQLAVAQFRGIGGGVINSDPAWAWDKIGGTNAAASAFRTKLQPYLKTAPVQVSGGPPRLYAVSYRKPGPPRRLVVAITNDFSWVQFSTSTQPIPKERVNTAPPQAAGVQVSWRTGHGLPEADGHPPRLHQLRAVDAVTGKPLGVHAESDGYRVELPEFQFMALLDVTESSLPGPLPRKP
jgi:hypothetical protein